MSYRFIFSIVVVASLCSCGESDSTVSYPNREDGHIVRLVAGFDANTRTELDGTAVKWSIGDKIVVNGEESEAATIPGTTTPLSAATATAQFTVTNLTDPVGPYYCLYPSGIYTSGYSSGSPGVYPVNLTTVQPYVSGSFGNGINPSVAYKNGGGTLNFKNVCGIAQAVVTGQPDVKKVRFLAKTEYVSGPATVTITSANSYALTMQSTATNKNYVDVEFSSVQDLSDPASATIYFVLPPASYTTGARIQLLNSSDGVIYEKYAGGAITVTAGYITDLGTIDCPSTTTPAAHTGWAGSAIYWDDSDPLNPHLTFDDVGDNTHNDYQGVFFKWGSLIGISPYAPSGFDVTNGTGTKLYVPGGVYPAPNGDTWSVQYASSGNAWSGTTFTDIPYNMEDVGTPSTMGETLSHLCASHLTFTGDICKFLTAHGCAPASPKGWRLSTGAEWRDTFSTSTASNTGSVSGTVADQEAGKGSVSEGYHSPMFMPYTGRYNGSTAVDQVGQFGRWWCGSGYMSGYGLEGICEYTTSYPTANSGYNAASRSQAHPARCVRN